MFGDVGRGKQTGDLKQMPGIVKTVDALLPNEGLNEEIDQQNPFFDSKPGYLKLNPASKVGKKLSEHVWSYGWVHQM